MVSLLAIAEETLAEFLSKATGTAVDWVQMIGMKVWPTQCVILVTFLYVMYIFVCENSFMLCNTRVFIYFLTL